MSFIASHLSIELTKAGYKATLHTHVTDGRKKLRPYSKVVQLPETSYLQMQKALLAIADGDISVAAAYLQNIEADIEKRPIVQEHRNVQAEQVSRPQPQTGIRLRMRDFRLPEKNEDLGLEL